MNAAKFGEIPPNQPFAKAPIGEQEADRPHGRQPSMAGDDTESLPHAVRTDHHEHGQGRHQRGLEGPIQHDEDDPGHREEDPVVIEQHGATHTEGIAAGPHREEVPVAEVCGVHLHDGRISQKLARRPSGTSPSHGQTERGADQNGDEEDALVLPVHAATAL
jgi:hypothetical protein